MRNILVTILLLILSTQVFSQAYTVNEYRVASNSVPFGINIPVGSKIVNVATNEYWLVETVNGLLSSATITTSIADLSIINGDTDLSNYVTIDGAETITGAKTFTANPTISNALATLTINETGSAASILNFKIASTSVGLVTGTNTGVGLTSTATQKAYIQGSGSVNRFSVDVDGIYGDFDTKVGETKMLYFNETTDEIVFGDAPGDTFVPTGSISLRYRYDQTSQSPIGIAAGYFRANNSDLGEANEFFFAEDDLDSKDRSAFFNSMVTGNIFSLIDLNGEDYYTFQLSYDEIDQTSYFTVPASDYRNSGSFADEEIVYFDFRTVSGSGTSITLTTTGTNGASTLTGSVLNVPIYAGGGGGDVSQDGTVTANQIPVWSGTGTIEGDANLTWDGNNLEATTIKTGNLHATYILHNAATPTTLMNLTADRVSMNAKRFRFGNISSAPSTPFTGDTYYNTTDGKLYSYIGSSWVDLGQSGGGTGTDLSIGTKTSTTLYINSSSGSNVLVPEATGTYAGLLSASKWGQITTNTAKISNVTHTGEVTGSAALTITNNVVDEANMKISNTPTNDFVLTADNGVTGGWKWAAGGSGSSNWTVSGSDIYRDSEVWIGGTTDLGAYELQVTGNSFASGDVEVGDDLVLYGSIYDLSGDVGDAGQVLSSTVTGTNWIDALGERLLASTTLEEDWVDGNVITKTWANSLSTLKIVNIPEGQTGQLRLTQGTTAYAHTLLFYLADSGGTALTAKIFGGNPTLDNTNNKITKVIFQRFGTTIDISYVYEN